MRYEKVAWAGASHAAQSLGSLHNLSNVEPQIAGQRRVAHTYPIYVIVAL